MNPFSKSSTILSSQLYISSQKFASLNIFSIIYSLVWPVGIMGRGNQGPPWRAYNGRWWVGGPGGRITRTPEKVSKFLKSQGKFKLYGKTVRILKIFNENFGLFKNFKNLLEFSPKYLEKLRVCVYRWLWWPSPRS